VTVVNADHRLQGQPNPMYRNAFVTVSGTLQAIDPNGPDWLPYLVRRTATLVRDSPVHYQTTVRTSRGDHFSVTCTAQRPRRGR
jgi:hypothetical protein